MKQNWKGPIGPVTMKFRDDRVAIFRTLEEALRAIGRRAAWRVVEAFPGISCPYRFGEPVILLDEFGMVIPTWRTGEEMDRLALGRTDPRVVRPGVPIPGTGRHRGGHYFRRPRTRAELRDLAGLDVDAMDPEDFPMRLRARVRRRNIPTAWDDIPIRGKGRNWKAFRRTRWKA